MGIDIVEIEEIKVSIKESKRFIERVFTEQEISHCESKSYKYASYAVRFAAKEAVMKALGTGWDMGVQWKQIEVFKGEERRETGDREEVNDERLSVKSKNSNRYSVIGDRKMLIAKNQELTANSHTGKPEIKLTGKALKLSKEIGVENIFLSLSHSKCYAVANVIFEGNHRLEYHKPSAKS